MASSVDAIIARFRVKYPECTSSVAQTIFSEAHRRILTRIQVRNTVQYVSFVALQREYALDVSIFKIHSAILEQGANSSYPLLEKSTDELDVMNPSWRQNGNTGTPYRYYITSIAVADSAQNAIGFDPLPNATTSGTYPRVALYTTAYAELSGAETVPSNLLDDWIYLYQMFAKWCEDADPGSSEFWEAKAEREFNRNHEHVQSMQSKGMTGIFPTVTYMPTRIV